MAQEPLLRLGTELKDECWLLRSPVDAHETFDHEGQASFFLCLTGDCIPRRLVHIGASAWRFPNVKIAATN